MSDMTPSEKKLHDIINQIVDLRTVTVEMKTTVENDEHLTVAILHHTLIDKPMYVALRTGNLGGYSEDGLMNVAKNVIFQRAKFFLNDEVLASRVRWVEIGKATSETEAQE